MASVAVVGVGAIGGAVAVALANDAVHHVSLCVRAPFAALEARWPDGSVDRHRLQTWASAADIPADYQPDVVVLATKAYQTVDAARDWLERLVRVPGTVLAVAQNGVDQVERLRPLVTTGTDIVPVTVYLPADRLAPGVVTAGADGMLEVPATAAGERFVALFGPAVSRRVRARTVADYATTAWRKLMINALAGGFGTLALRENAALAEPDVAAVALRFLDEVVAVARAEGASLPPDAGQRCLDLIVNRAGSHRSSIVVDRLVGRPLEWEVRNAVVGRLGARHGIPTPLNDLVTALLRVSASPPPIAPTI